MSNYIYILSKSYSTNVLNEAIDVRRSCFTMMNSKTLVERDLAKVLCFALKLFGTLSLIGLGLGVFDIVRKQSVSVGSLFFTVTCFFLTFDLLKASNNLREKYVVPLEDKLKGVVGVNSISEIPDKLKVVKNHDFRGDAKQVFPDANENELEICTRVFRVVVKDTSILEPVARVFGFVE